MDDPQGPPASSGPYVPRPPWETAQAPANAPPAPPTTPRRRTWLVGALVVVLLAWFCGVATFGLRASDLPRTTASTFVPPDAYRDAALVKQGDVRSQAMVENAWVRGTYLRWSISPFLFRYMVPPPGVAGDQVGDVRWWREAVITGNSDQPPRYRVFSVTGDGVRLHGQDWGQQGLTLEPAPLWLPADVHAGQSWTGRGIATGVGFDGLLRYRMTAKAETPEQGGTADDGCLQLTYTTELTPEDASDSASATRWTETDLWCPGQGVVDSAGTLDDVDYSVSTREGRPAEPPSGSTTEPTPDPANLASWRQGELDGIEGDETFGTVPMEVPFEKAPVVTASGSIAFRSDVTTDLVGLLPVDSGKRWLHWWARPGGQILSLATFGRTTIVTTSDRKMMAYEPGGRLLWSVTLDDVALDPPVRVSDDRMAVVSTRGMVSLRSVVDGRQLWSHRVPHGISHPLASDGSVIAAVDNDQTLHVLDARTGAERWTTEVELTANLLAVANGTTVVAASRVEAYDNRTGERRWHRYVQWSEGLRIDDTTVAVDSVAGVELLDLADGSQRGSIPGADEPRPVGGSWFMLTSRSIVAVDDAGERTRSWRLSVPAQDREIVVGPARVWVFGRTSDKLFLVGEWVGPA